MDPTRIDRAKNHHSDFVALLTGYRKKLRAIDADPRLSFEAKAGDRYKLREATLADIERLAASRAEDIEAVRNVTGREAAPLYPLNDTQKLARVVEEERAIRRADRQLAAGVALTELITQAGEARDLTTLRAIGGELPSMKPGSHNRQERDALAALIDRTERPLLPEKERAARETFDAMDWSSTALGMNSAMVRGEVEGNPASMLIDAGKRKGTVALPDA